MDYLKDYFSCEGRISRKKYFWRIILWFFIIIILNIAIGLMLITVGVKGVTAMPLAFGIGIGIFIKLPNDVKRFHDLNFSGWLCLAFYLVAFLLDPLVPFALVIIGNFFLKKDVFIFHKRYNRI